ncbi:MAG: fatty acid desaturase [Pseudomonas sp.]|uniref:fatty acid desaturase family protein n=1 Tax=Pseudomonas sp. TaxID=306 RepID=UPI0030F02F6D
MLQLFKETRGAVYHGLALVYALAGYGLGIAGLFSPHLAVNLLAMLWLAHAMIIAGYLLHECAHNTVFKTNEHNALLGKLLTWVTGSCYGTYEDIRLKHFRHHVDNADIIWFEYDKWFARHPLVLKTVQALEWFYIPAHDVLMHGVMVFSAFIIPQRKSQRARNVAFIVLRGSLFAALLWFFPLAALLYVVAYLLMMTVLRFMDAPQHDYGGTATLFDKAPGPYKGDRTYEQAHTFSNLLSRRWPWLNVLVLNFGFHNAHHAKPTTPWYRLPALHRELYGDERSMLIPFLAQLKSFHRFRVSRVVMMEGPSADSPDYLALLQSGHISGGNAASFLTSF